MRCWSYAQNSQPPADTLFSNLSPAEIPILCNVLMPLAFLRCHIHWSRIPCMKRPSSCIADTRHFIHTDVGICAHVDAEDLTDAIARRHAFIAFCAGSGGWGLLEPTAKGIPWKGVCRSELSWSLAPLVRQYRATGVGAGWKIAQGSLSCSCRASSHVPTQPTFNALRRLCALLFRRALSPQRRD